MALAAWRPGRLAPSTALLLGLTLGVSISLTVTSLTLLARSAWRRSLSRSSALEDPNQVIEIRTDQVLHGVEALIGNTPLIRIKSLSDATGVEILGKCEFLNPFGSVKDRISLSIIKQAEADGLLVPHTGCTIFEGTSGSTGISIAGIARARGYNAYIVLPDDVAKEKVQLLEALGATVEKVRPVSIVCKNHYVNLARQRALEFISPSSTSSHHLPGFFLDQFENPANLSAHYTSTAPEIFSQTSGIIHAFVSGAGTGGTIAGVGRYLREKIGREVEIILGDVEGSGLFNRVREGVMYAEEEKEGQRRRFQVDTVVEGIGLNRLTSNFENGLEYIDDAFRATDEEAIAISRHLATQDGLFFGSSAAVNLVVCLKLIKARGWEGSRKQIVTILCDSGNRHFSKFWNDEYLTSVGLKISDDISHLL